MKEWRLIDSGPGDASFNMAIDEAIAISVLKGSSPPSLRFYGWETPSVSLGYFQRIDEIHLHYCLQNNIPVVRRPTGGRAILHGDELTYSFSSRNDERFSGGLKETYSLIGHAFLGAFRMMGLDVEMMERRQKGNTLIRSPLCFNSVSFGEISLRGIKLIGSAQRRWNEGFLQQGSIPYSVDEGLIKKVFRISSNDSISPKGLRVFIDPEGMDIKGIISRAFEETFGVRIVLSPPFHDEILLAEQLLEEKYRRPEWNLQGLKGMILRPQLHDSK